MSKGTESEETLFTLKELSSAINWDIQGLVTAVVQDVRSREVLMVAYMNAESLARTLTTGQTWFWSRSRSELWNKGATSGHVQHVRSIRYDCDVDALLIEVDQEGAACHTGRSSCFYRGIDVNTGEALGMNERETNSQTNVQTSSQTQTNPLSILTTLEALIAKRDQERPEGAYTTYLFEHGVDKILKKVGEEASEVIIAAKNRDLKELRYESADLIYHLMVLWQEQGLSMDVVLDELAGRHLKQKGDYPSHAN